MKERLPWFPCYPTKLLGALAGMPSTEQLVYLIMLLRIYEAGGACPDSLEAISRRVGHNKRTVSEALNSLFKAGRLRREPDGIHNPVADDVVAETVAFREGRSLAGQKGARVRWEKTERNQSKSDSKANGSANAKPMANDSHLHLHLEESLFPKEGNKAVSVKNGHATETEEAALFRRGKEILGQGSGGLITKLLKTKNGSVSDARAIIESAVKKNDPREYVAGAIRRPTAERDDTVDPRLG